MLLKDKTIIVTGAGGGLGAGIARVCAREGANVIVNDVRAEAAATIAQQLGGSCVAVAGDLRDDDTHDALLAQALEAFGRVDGLVNNAGANFAKPFFETTPQDWEWIISLDLRAVFFLTQKVTRQMVWQGDSGSVVNISSVHSQSCLPGAGPYDAAKWGVVGMGKSMAVELAPQGIRVNAISPGLLNTQIWQDLQSAAPSPAACLDYWKQNIPIERVIETEEIGELAAFLLCDRSSSITGANIFADGGMTSQLVSREPFASQSIEGR